MTDHIIINGQAIETQVAITREEQEKGLMFQKYPKPMVFLYAMPAMNTFWMKQTPAPLDIVFALRNKVVGIRSGLPNSTALIGVESASDLILELPAGQVKRLGLKTGDAITTKLSDSTLKKLILQSCKSY
jgi:uncharacterized membrane protein (UPF0127 family)